MKASKKAGTASASPSDLVLFKGQPPPVAGLLYLRRSRLQFAFPGTVLLWHSSSSHGWIQTHTHCTRMPLTRLTEWERSYCCNKKTKPDSPASASLRCRPRFRPLLVPVFLQLFFGCTCLENWFGWISSRFYIQLLQQQHIGSKEGTINTLKDSYVHISYSKILYY